MNIVRGFWSILFFPIKLRGYTMEISTAKNYNVIVMSFAFMLVFTGFNTMSGIQTMIFNSATTPNSGGYIEGFNGDGFTAAAVIYAVFSVASWLSPSIVTWKGPRFGMIVAGITYAQYIAQLLKPNTYVLYVSAVIIGLGAPVIWTAQGNFLALNSDDNTISRNSGLFWGMLQMSTFIGNTFAYFMFAGQEFITTETRTIVGAVLLGLTIAGVATMLLLRPTTWITVSSSSQSESPSQALKSAGAFFVTKDMLLLSLTFFYTGLQLSFWSAVYPTSVGFTKTFGDNRKALATLCSIFIAVGEVSGGAIFGFLGHLTAKRGRDPIVITGFIISMISYFLMFLNLPFNSPLDETKETDHAFITSNQYLAVLTAFLLGFSDACFNTQITSILGGAFKDKSVAGFAIFKFVQSFSCAIAFFYSKYLTLQWQLLITVIMDVFGTISFCLVEWKAKLTSEKDESQQVDTSCAVMSDPESDSLTGIPPLPE